MQISTKIDIDEEAAQKVGSPPWGRRREYCRTVQREHLDNEACSPVEPSHSESSVYTGMRSSKNSEN